MEGDNATYQEEVIVFERATQTVRGHLLKTAINYLHNAEEAEDAVQETLMRCWVARHRLHHIEEMPAFAMRIVKRHDFDEIIERFEEFSHEDSNCYAINSMSESSNGDRVGNARNLMIGEDLNNYVIIGKDYTNFINVNVLDAADATKTHRYAYAIEWREAHKGKVDVRYIITYAKIPSVTASIKEGLADNKKAAFNNVIAT